MGKQPLRYQTCDACAAGDHAQHVGSWIERRENQIDYSKVRVRYCECAVCARHLAPNRPSNINDPSPTALDAKK